MFFSLIWLSFVLQQTVNNSVITLCFSRNSGTGADPVPETLCYKVLFILMLEMAEKPIKLVFGTEVLSVTKNHTFGHALEKKFRIWIRSGSSFSLCLARSVWRNFDNANRVRFLEDIVTILLGRLHKKHVLYVAVRYKISA